MHFRFSLIAATLFPCLALPVFAQHRTPSPLEIASEALPDAPQPQADGSSTAQQAPNTDPNKQQQRQQDTQDRQQSPTTPAGTPAHTPVKPPPQPKRILGLMPNYRAVSAGEIPPPPTPRKAFEIATKNSFDYSGLVFVGITSLMAEGTNAHSQLGKGVPGFWGYYWRGFADKTDGNYWVIFIMPTIVHEDERYYAKGQGPILNRLVYASSRVLITPDYKGKNTFNAAEIFGRGISQSISLTYYPSKDQALGPFMEKYAYALGRDALTNAFREVWPDINQHIHRHKQHS